jgi:NhaP-type Na+/H+ or K+/H+ antiporter
LTDSVLVGLALIPVLAVAAQLLAVRLALPSIVVLLVVGFVAGAPSWGLDPDELMGDTLFPFVSLAVAVILFEGGLTLRLDEIRGGTHKVVRRLLGLGVVVTWAAITIVAVLVLDIAPELAVLIGAILVVSGPTVVGPLLDFIGIGGRTGSILRWEGILVDPIGAITAILVLHAISAGESFSSPEGVIGFVESVGWGATVGVAGAALLLYLLYVADLPRSLQAVTTLATVLGVFVAAGALREDSGYVSVVLMGAIMANQSRVPTREIHEFKETIGLLLTGVLFIILSARISPTQLAEAAGPALVLLAFVIIVIRPLAAWLSCLGSDLDWRERTLVASLAPRGIVAASTASIASISLAGSGLAGLDTVVPTVFIVIVGTVTVYGVGAPVLARALGLAGGPEDVDEEQLAGVIEVGED